MRMTHVEISASEIPISEDQQKYGFCFRTNIPQHWVDVVTSRFLPVCIDITKLKPQPQAPGGWRFYGAFEQSTTALSCSECGTLLPSLHQASNRSYRSRGGTLRARPRERSLGLGSEIRLLLLIRRLALVALVSGRWPSE